MLKYVEVTENLNKPQNKNNNVYFVINFTEIC